MCHFFVRLVGTFCWWALYSRHVQVKKYTLWFQLPLKWDCDILHSVCRRILIVRLVSLPGSSHVHWRLDDIPFLFFAFLVLSPREPVRGHLPFPLLTEGSRNEIYSTKASMFTSHWGKWDINRVITAKCYASIAITTVCKNRTFTSTCPRRVIRKSACISSSNRFVDWVVWIFIAIQTEVNGSINKSINQSINQSNNQSINQSIN